MEARGPPSRGRRRGRVRSALRPAAPALWLVAALVGCGPVPSAPPPVGLDPLVDPAETGAPGAAVAPGAGRTPDSTPAGRATSDAPGTATGAARAGPTAPPPTFARDVAPLLFGSCASCHRPGGTAPFSVLAYETVAPHADAIAAATARDDMPPWLPRDAPGTFARERRLTPEEIALLADWARAGAPPGDLAATPPAPPFPEWPLGPPDLVLEAPPVPVPADGRDLYRNVVLPSPVERPTWIRAVDLRPGDAEDGGVVHHARLMVDTTVASRAADAADPLPGFDGMDVRGGARNPPGHFVGWTPGRAPHGGHADLAWSMASGTDLVLQLHLRPTGRATTVRPRLGLYLAEGPPVREAVLVMLGTEVIDLPAGEAAVAVADSFTLPVPVEVLSVYPHAHYLARAMEGWARRPDGETGTLLSIDDWDFDWQDQYHFARPVRLPAGTVVGMRFTYDNSAANPRNPSEPPVRVRYGPASTDEMADLILQVVPTDAADAGVLRRELAWKYEAGVVRYLAWEAWTQGLDAVAAGDPAAALDHYRASLRYRDDPAVMAAMARAALELGDTGLATVAAERAAALTGRTDPRILETLASAYAAGGRAEAAIAVLEEALALARGTGQEDLVDRLRTHLRTLGGAGDG